MVTQVSRTEMEEAQEGPWGGTWPSLQVRDSFLKKAHTGLE